MEAYPPPDEVMRWLEARARRGSLGDRVYLTAAARYLAGALDALRESTTPADRAVILGATDTAVRELSGPDVS